MKISVKMKARIPIGETRPIAESYLPKVREISFEIEFEHDDHNGHLPYSFSYEADAIRAAELRHPKGTKFLVVGWRESV